MIKHLSPLIFLLLAQGALAQVTFTELPLNKQLVGRDLTSNLGTVRIAGLVNFSGVSYQKIRVEVRRDGVFLQAFQQSLNSNYPTDDFDFSIAIPAELANYSFKVLGLNGASSTTLADVSDVVAGDVYIIQGQSNAEAPVRSDSCNQYENPFIRVYAGGIPIEANLASNNNWYYGQGDGNRFSNGNTGQWGLKLAYDIVDKYGIPVAIFNGAHGGKSISFFQRPPDYDSSLASNYGRLYYRLHKTGLKNFVRAVFWSQGEQDGFPGLGTTTTSYKDMFMALHDAWSEDFPSIQNLYIFQTRNGCNAPVFDLMEVKEAQRELAIEQNDIQIISTAGLEYSNDNCHFNFIGGYKEFAKRLFALVDRDLYGAVVPPDSDSPMILNVFYTGNNFLRVETNATLLTGTPLINEFLLSDANGTSIVDVFCSGSDYYLELDSNPGDSAKLSYLGPNPGLGGTHIVNSEGIELLCYYRYTIVGQSYSTNPTSTALPFSVFPNPAMEKLYIRGANFSGCELLNTSGKVVFHSREPVLDLSHLPGGLYFLRIAGDSQVQVEKIRLQE
jgi:hypothetical protein